ncbi:MAG: TraR/DksA family transcriptional regulator [Acidobacteriota bacterium]
MTEELFPTEELERFRERLLAAKAEVLQRVQRTESGGRAVNETTGARDTGDQAQDSFTRDLMFGLSQSDRALLREIEAALRRIAEGTFGICEMTGEPIEKKRLEAIPWARYSLKAQEKMERSAGSPRRY